LDAGELDHGFADGCFGVRIVGHDRQNLEREGHAHGGSGMNAVINWGLFKHPLNWLTVILMVLIGGAAFHFAMEHLKQK
jgi:hypothetical protein